MRILFTVILFFGLSCKSTKKDKSDTFGKQMSISFIIVPQTDGAILLKLNQDGSYVISSISFLSSKSTIKEKGSYVIVEKDLKLTTYKGNQFMTFNYQLIRDHALINNNENLELIDCNINDIDKVEYCLYKKATQ